ncbi:MAG TPA: hypothetical protein DDX40_04790 [Rikenellaceae bacterium]|nr:hypothetical protein [Rikenellaceae bacterium]
MVPFKETINTKEDLIEECRKGFNDFQNGNITKNDFCMFFGFTHGEAITKFYEGDYGQLLRDGGFNKGSEAYFSGGINAWKNLRDGRYTFPPLETQGRIESDDPSLSLLRNNRNLVLTGAPGTGKTFMAKRLAAHLVSEGASDKDSLTEEQEKRIGFVQFHPSFDYTDFVEGLRPDANGNFRRQDGIFKEFCKKALHEKEKDFVFIIDEINRGELSKIFGELFFSIEPDYRGMKGRVKTQYNNMVENGDEFEDGFFVPENVYIIGTMNDVDRGVEAMDFAIRRRFAWKEVTAEDSAVNMSITGKALVRMKAVNGIIKDKLSAAHCIGGAYFLKLKDDDFAALWNNHLCGIITEYFRGEPEADKQVEEIKKAYDNAYVDITVQEAGPDTLASGNQDVPEAE